MDDRREFNPQSTRVVRAAASRDQPTGAKPPDARTDIYGAGAVLYELATGHRPFGRRTGVGLADAILHEPPPPPRSLVPPVSPGLEAVILKALDKDPELRYQSARELLVDLERLPQAGSPTGPTATARRGRVRTWVGVAAAVAAIGSSTWLVAPRAGGGESILRVPIAGGEPARVSVPFRFLVGILDYVPSESALLVSGLVSREVVEKGVGARV
jgi:hypothetical protein